MVDASRSQIKTGVNIVRRSYCLSQRQNNELNKTKKEQHWHHRIFIAGQGCRKAHLKNCVMLFQVCFCNFIRAKMCELIVACVASFGLRVWHQRSICFGFGKRSPSLGFGFGLPNSPPPSLMNFVPGFRASLQHCADDR